MQPEHCGQLEGVGVEGGRGRDPAFFPAFQRFFNHREYKCWSFKKQITFVAKSFFSFLKLALLLYSIVGENYQFLNRNLLQPYLNTLSQR